MTDPGERRSKLNLRDVGKVYGSIAALKPTTLDVSDGEFLTVLGPSGSGKTTLLGIIAGLAPVSGGRILLDGHDVTGLPSFRRDIGVIFQNYALFPHLTVAENLAFPLRMRNISAAAIGPAVTEALRVVRLSGLEARYPRELSGGQQQRVAFARAIIFKPSLVLMDEPLGALDRNLREELKLEIRKLHRELGMTVLYVTHDQEEAMVLSDRICLMNDGRIEQLDTPHGLYFTPRTPFAARFVGDSNMLPCRVLGVAGGLAELALAGGQAIRAACDGAVQGGLAMVRPEHIGITPAGVDTADGTNCVEGLLEDRTVSGPLTRYLVRLASGEGLVALALTSRAAPLGPGQAVRLNWSAADTILIAEETPP